MPRINLLLNEKSGRFHYIWIKDINRLLYQESRHCYSRKDLLKAHQVDCKGIGQTAVRVEMAEDGRKKAHLPKLPQATPSPLHHPRRLRGPDDKNRGGWAEPWEEQPAKYGASRGLQLLLQHCLVRRPHWTGWVPGARCSQAFPEEHVEAGGKIQKRLSSPATMRMTREDWAARRSAKICHVCNKELFRDSFRDHCHISGRYRSAAHNECNFKLRLYPREQPYRWSSTICGVTTRISPCRRCRGRPPRKRKAASIKYISYSIGQLPFIDSVQFLFQPLDRMVVANTREASKITYLYEPDAERLQLLRRKGVYPYEYMDSLSRFAETGLPSKVAVCRRLSGEKISDEDYAQAQKVSATFRCRTLGHLQRPLLSDGCPPAEQRFGSLQRDLLGAVRPGLQHGSRPIKRRVSSWRRGGPYPRREAGPQSPRKRPLCVPLQESAAISLSRDAPDYGSCCPTVQTEPWLSPTAGLTLSTWNRPP